MAYNILSSDSGSDDAGRREEAKRIIDILDDFMEQLTQKERTFVEQMNEGGPVTVKQLFWLRDIKDRYVD